MANDSDLFRTQEQLEADGWRLEGNIFARRRRAICRCMKAKMI